MRCIYIDLGANIGETVFNFLSDRSGFSCYAFEPNIDLIPKIAKVGLELGRDINIVWGAAWICDGTVDLFHSGSPAASTIVPGKVEYTERGWPAIDYSKPYVVPSIDFSQWILRNFSKDDYIFLKMDIEGAEYKVLKRMVEDGSIALISRLRCEWHYDRYPEISEKEHHELRNAVARKTDLEDWH